MQIYRLLTDSSCRRAVNYPGGRAKGEPRLEPVPAVNNYSLAPEDQFLCQS